MIARIQEWRDGHGKPGGRAEAARRYNRAQLRASAVLYSAALGAASAVSISGNRVILKYRARIRRGERSHRAGACSLVHHLPQPSG
jgi:hypothetical protein